LPKRQLNSVRGGLSDGSTPNDFLIETVTCRGAKDGQNSTKEGGQSQELWLLTSPPEVVSIAITKELNAAAGR